MSYLSTNCREDVEQWLNRRLSSHYLAIYIDTTFIAIRRDKQVSKEAYYTILAVLEDGSREVLSVVIKRQILNCASHKDKSQIAEKLNEVFTLENKEMKSLLGYQKVITFVGK